MKSLILFTALLVPVTVVAESHQPPGPGVAFLNHYDSDKDGKVTLMEYQAPAVKQFLLIDLDADGIITSDEATAFVTKLREEMKKRSSEAANK
jgi:Ca2+-binding EF-hand superfamily protein